MLSLIISIIALGFIIFFHELGHFLLAKACGVGVVEFSLGMGPRLLTLVRGNTRYSLKALPFGGSCMMVGEDPEMTGEEEGETSSGHIELDGRVYGKESSFLEKPAWKRFLIIAAGPVFNFILAFLLSLVITQQAGVDRPVILSVEEGMPAAQTEIRPGDTVLALNGENITVYRDIQMFLLMHQQEIADGMPVSITYAHEDGNRRTETILPAYAEDTGSYRMGLVFSGSYQPVTGAGELLRYSAYNVEFCIRSTVSSLELLFTGRVHKDDVMGPVRMVAVMDDTVETASQYGLWSMAMSLMNLALLISASLGAMNLLPIPALDGGQLLFILIEMICRRPLPREWIGRINMAGMLFLLGLMFLILFNDISFMLR